MPYTQANRLLRLDTPLGDDVLLLEGFTGQEGISQIFKFDLDIMTEGDPIDFNKIIGEQVTIRVELLDDKERFFNGFINRFAQTGSETGVIHYRAEMVPWLWFLTRTADCRIFQNKSIPDIIEQIFKDLGFTDYKLDLQGTYDECEYCVQYRETDFNFVSRLMEQYGIYYFFEHEEDKHTLLLGDSPSVHQPVPNQPKANFEPKGSGTHEKDVITSLEFEKEIRPGKYTHTDYNFSMPSTKLEAEEKSVIEIAGNDKYEIYDYPGEYPKKANGSTLAKIRMQEEEAQHFIITGSSSCRAFTSGYKFDLEDYKPDDLNQSYLLTDSQHVGSMGDTYTPGGATGGEESYSNTFVCIPHSVPFRPPQVTPKPLVQGPQTAVVVGPSGEEIYSDEYGRVKIQFHWDREGKKDENSSCWVRVSQLWAGKGWGAMYIPRIGQEVIVEFLEGDPDRPIITGRVYNAEHMPPYELPTNQTMSTIKTLSSKGGEGFNEIRFEDKKDSEQLFFHAEKNMDVRIKNDTKQYVGRNSHLKIIQDQVEEIQNDRHETIARDQITEIGRDQHANVKGKQAVEIGDSHSFTVSGDVVEVFKADHSEETSGDIYVKGSNIVIEAMTNITLKVGGSYIAIEAGGITIEGAGPVEVKSPNTTVSGDGMLTLEGGVVKIN